ncbi:Os11g0125700 [Oryza sativa Japonica Group]|uniref:Os11g0125700 protein n=1 Tax=Oryza sativa subsp. japonica TaxID=39947 RepID=A0A0P0XY83_ORYSJ|nr:hypothetical protein EE612_053248 [Oryza sativa]BAT12478.1 Os11g0125700 [Oryza sativa Japonica Group]
MEVKSSPLRSMIGSYQSVAITIGAFCQAPSTPLGGSHVYTTKGSIFNPIISHFLDPHTNLYCTSGMTTHLGSDDMQEYSSRPPQIDQSDLTNNCSARQIYLTFPPDSIFSKEDVCNYFSMYGMVQDVRIPYQEKRMFGFVTFAYQKTVKLILAKGNPHYICDARVLVKPYKEKDKVPNKFRHVNHCLIPLLTLLAT